MKLVFMLVGAVVGLLLVRAFMLDAIEEIGWRLFWDALLNGHVSTSAIGKVLGSSTFTKSAIGMGVGAVLGLLAGRQLGLAK